MWMLKIHQVQSVAMWLDGDGLNLYGWVVEPKTPNQAFKIAWWLVVHSFLICCYAGPFEEKCGSAVKAFFVNKVATADSKREFRGISMNDIKNELR